MAQHAQEMAEVKEQITQMNEKGNKKQAQELQTFHENELKKQQERADAQRKLQQAEAEIQSLQGRLAELESKGGCVVC